MKINILKPVALSGLVVLALACSTRKDSWLSRNSHALSTKYNILYNGGLAMDAGKIDLQTKYADNFWEVLPVEQMQPEPDKATIEALEAAASPEMKVPAAQAQPSVAGKAGVSGKAGGKGAPAPQAVAPVASTPAVERNPNFTRAEEKATKAIQKHSMNIGGSEKNPQMDEAHLMLGQARYYDQRYLPALEAFNYVLYKYPSSNKINEVKIWKEKANMRLENETHTIANLQKLLKEIKLKDQIYADANATLAQAFINTEEQDSAISRLKTAVDFTKKPEEESRYQFIIGQLYDLQKNRDSADAYYQKVIDMNRRGPRMYMIQSILKLTSRFDAKTGDTLAFNEHYEKLLNDRENRPFLDWINFQYALHYDGKMKNPEKALKYYNKSLDAGPNDEYLNASNYRNIADIYFNKAEYVTAGIYYDSTMIHLKPRTREFRLIEKKRLNLEDVIKYEAIAKTNDSILNVVGMSETARKEFFQKHIEKLKAEDEKRKALAEKEKAIAENAANPNRAFKDNGSLSMGQNSFGTPASLARGGNAASKGGPFYFYSPMLVNMGKQEFQKNWGKRKLEDNWRTARPDFSSDPTLEETPEQEAERLAAEEKAKTEADIRYSTDFYVSQLPTDQKVIDSLGKERNFAYYQLGVIYKEKFKEYHRAADKLEKLLSQNPEERLILPSEYYLYKIYEIIDKSKAAQVKEDIIKFYPDSRYAQILSQNQDAANANDGPEAIYLRLFKEYEAGDYVGVYPKIEEAIDQFTGEEIVPKFELLKARTIGKMRGLEEYKKALNYTALTYPNSAEGKEAELLLGKDIVLMEYMQFNDREPKSWKLLYRAPNVKDKKIVTLQGKLKKFISERTSDQLSQSVDFFTPEMNFVVVHGIRSKEGAMGIVTVLKEFKEYKVTEVPIIISSENYSVVQIKKNLEEYVIEPDRPADKRPAPNVRATADVAKPKVKLQPRAKKARPVNNVSASPFPGSAAVPPQDPDAPNSFGNQQQQQRNTQNRQPANNNTGGNLNMAPPGK